MEHIHLENCPLCGSTKIKTQMKCTDHYASGETFEIAGCQDCGFRFTQDFPDESQIGSYYETKDYVSHSDTHKGLINKIYHIVRGYMLKKKARLVESRSHLKQGRILDIGCGTGYFLDTMQQRGWNVQGVEKSPLAADFGRNHFSLKIEQDLWDLDSEEKTYDAITLWHVLEHLQDLEEVFTKLRELLRKKGTLIIAVPNCDSKDAHIYKEYWGAYDVPRHLWHFTPQTIKQLAKREGFRVEQMLPMPFDAFYVSMLSEKYKGHCLSFIRGFISGIRAYLACIGKPGKSSSIIYILRKI